MLHGHYRFRFYINASHGIYIDNRLGELHPHTWEIILTVMNIDEAFAPFHEVEKLCEACFSMYQDRVLNEIPPFTTLNPTLENIANVLRDEVQNRLRPQGWVLLSIEVSETPSRSFIIHTTGTEAPRQPTYSSANEEEVERALRRIAQKTPQIRP